MNDYYKNFSVLISNMVNISSYNPPNVPRNIQQLFESLSS